MARRVLAHGDVERVFGARFVFFTGKGGVGKTSLACATAVSLADRGRKVLLVSTDPASNLDETLGVALSGRPVAVPGVPSLWALNIDPEEAAEAYRARVLAPLRATATQEELDGLREQLSGACTTEIAAFDAFAGLLADASGDAWDQVIFDTAPTGHTLRLLSLPAAWTRFFDTNERGASCLGPHSALENEQGRFEAAFRNLADPACSTVVLVARPEDGALREAARTATELAALGLARQLLVVNAVFRASDRADALAVQLQAAAEKALELLPEPLRGLETYVVPMQPFNTVGLPAIRRLFDAPDLTRAATDDPPGEPVRATWSLRGLVDELATKGHALVLVMGKGGVGKTTVAAALAVGLARRGVAVHLSTTDPAAHVAGTVAGASDLLKVSRIDPRAETEAYTARILATKGATLDDDGRALLREDLASPCTEEVAVFHAFSRVVFESRRGVVILDTAPTGHTLLLLDAAGSYHREMLRKTEGTAAARVVTPLMQLRNPDEAKVLLVTLPETTPVSEAAALQEDLRRAGVEPAGWVVNRSLAAAGVRDPLLAERARLERPEFDRVHGVLAARTAILPAVAEEPVGMERLLALLDAEAPVEAA